MRSRLVSLLLAGVAAAALPAVTACTGTGHAYVVADYEDPPPPMREEYVATRPGFIWIHGNWHRDHHRWRWTNGHYERQRAGYVYRDGRWTRNGRNWVWVRGTWEPRGQIVIRGRGRL